MNFQFATAAQIVFGWNASESVPERCAAMGKRIFMLTGGHPGRLDGLTGRLKELGLAVEQAGVEGEPDLLLIRDLVRQARNFQSDSVLAAGGGSVIDAGKAVAALLTNPGGLTEYLEIVGRGRPIQNRPVPMAALPTTAGTGAEVTRNAVLTATEERVKVSMRHPWMIPDLAVIDPGLTLSMPAEVTAGTGLDALTQLIEPFVTHANNPLTDGFCREGLKRAARSLVKAFERGDDREARENMALASLLGGLALANAKLGAVHGIAGPMGGMFRAPHGIICARLLPHVMNMNVRKLGRMHQESPLLPRYRELAVLLTGEAGASAEDGVQWILETCESLHVPPLEKYGVTREDFPLLAEKAGHASSMRGNPVPLSGAEVIAILEAAVFE